MVAAGGIMTETDRFGALGQRIAQEQDVELAGADLSSVRARLLSNSASRAPLAKRRVRRIAYVGASLAAAALAVFAVWTMMPRGPEPLAVSINGETLEAEALGNWLSAPTNASLPIKFSDGTQVNLEAKSRARILRVGEHGAHVVLESGNARLNVIPTGMASWQVSAGPFLVDVVGTRFDVAWSPEDDVFTLNLRQGKVNLSGCLFGSGRSVVAGETVRASCKTKEYEIKTRGSKQAEQSELDAVDSEKDVAASAKEPAVVSPPKPAATNWQTLAHAGKYKEAVELATEAGFDKVLGQASAQDLTLLGDAARFSGDSAKAVSAYSALRSRFPGGDRAANAAYSLARLHFDQRGAFNEAARWFRTYLSERPSGSLAREAQGRLLECLRRSGNHAAAERQARLYLKRYPDGPHAALARSVTSNNMR